jgi:hypothetical protein
MPSRTARGLDPYRLILALIPCALFFYELLGISYFAGWDITRLNLPLKWFDVQSIRAGAMPLWNPYLYAGMPQLAESESGLFYPGNWLLHLPGDFFYWANITIIIHLIMGGLFFDLWLRGRAVDKRASFIASALFQTSPCLIFHISSMAMMQAMVWFGLVLWISDRLMEAKNRREIFRLSLLSSLLWGMLLLVGNVQIVFYMGLLTGFYLLGYVFSAREKIAPRLYRALGYLLWAAFSGVMISAIVLVPASEFVKGTVRESAGPGFYNLGTWLTPSRLASAFYFPAFSRQPEWVNWASSVIYVGLLPSILMLLRLMGIKTNWRKDAPLILMFGSALFLAFGMNNPVNHLLVKFAPFSMFRYQGRMALGVIFGLLGLASTLISSLNTSPALSTSSLGRDEGGASSGASKRTTPALNTSPPLGGDSGGGINSRQIRYALLVIFLSLFFFIINAHRSKGIMLGAIVLFADIALTWWAVARLSRGGLRSGFPLWAIVYVAFHVALIFPVGRLATMYTGKFYDAFAFLDGLKRLDGLPARLLVIDVGEASDRDILEFNKFTPQESLPNLLAGNAPIFRGVATMDPYTPLRPKIWDSRVRGDLKRFFEESNSAGTLNQAGAWILRGLGVDYVITSGGVHQIPGYMWMEADISAIFGSNAVILHSLDELPRAWITHQPPPDAQNDMTWSIPFSIPQVGNSVPMKLGPNSASLECSTQTEAWCVVQLSSDPGWEVKIDGAPAEARITDGLFYAVHIPGRGEHVIEFRYNPPSFRVGLLMTVVSLLTVLFGLLMTRPTPPLHGVERGSGGEVGPWE